MYDARRKVWEHLASMKRPASIAERRAVYDELFADFKLSADVSVEPVVTDRFRGEWLLPPDADPHRAVIYMHGGGYVRGSLRSHRHLVGEIARECGSRALHVDYRLAPEHPFPAAIEDVVAAYDYVVSQGVPPAGICLAGDSAGAGLVLAAMLKLKESGAPLPACGWSLSGWFDMEALGESMELKKSADPYVRKEFILALAAEYLGSGDRRNPLAAAIYADLRNLPPLLLQVGSSEVLLDDSVELARRAGLADVDVSLEIWPQMAHVWHLFFPWLEDAKAAIKSGATFVKKRVNAAA